MGGKGQTKAMDKIEEIFHRPLGTFEERLKRDRASEDDYLRKESIQIGIQQGIEQGIEQGKIEIAKRMIDKGFSFEDISLATNLSLDEIKNLK